LDYKPAILKPESFSAREFGLAGGVCIAAEVRRKGWTAIARERPGVPADRIVRLEDA